MKKMVKAEAPLNVAMDLSEEERAAIIENEVSVLKPDTHAKVIVAKDVRNTKKNFKTDRKIKLEAETEQHYKGMNAPTATKEGLVILNDCKVLDTLPGAKFKVQAGPNVIVCYLNGKLRQNKIQITVGDLVRVELSAYNMTNGRITWRQ